MHAEAPSRPPVLSDRSPEDLDPLDIAHALSHLCSYAGHVDRMYTVAKRCLHLSNYVALEDALAALLHDVTAAYVVDVSRPLRSRRPQYRWFRGRITLAIAHRSRSESRQRQQA